MCQFQADSILFKCAFLSPSTDILAPEGSNAEASGACTGSQLMMEHGLQWSGCRQMSKLPPMHCLQRHQKLLPLPCSDTALGLSLFLSLTTDHSPQPLPLHPCCGCTLQGSQGPYRLLVCLWALAVVDQLPSWFQAVSDVLHEYFPTMSSLPPPDVTLDMSHLWVLQPK